MEKTYTSQADEEFFGAIGRLTIAWAHLEFGLDGVILEIHRYFRGRDFEAEMPRSLSRKLSYLRTWAKKMPFPEETTADYLSLFDSIQRNICTRHDLVHGIVTEMAEGSGAAVFGRLIREGDGFKVRKFKLTTVEILKAAKEVQRLSGKTMYWARELQKFVSEHTQPDDAQKRS